MPLRTQEPRRVAVVTGGTAGVGRATARELARRGYDVAVLARGREGLAGARRDIEALGRRALTLQVDVADASAVDGAALEVERGLGPIDVWVNNAMTSVLSPVRAMRAEEYRRVTEVTYLGYVHGTLAALRQMLPRDRGTIVQVSSALAFRSIPLQSAYCGAKHAIIGFTDSLRAELIHDGSGVRVTAVHLPGVDTPQFDWVRNRMGMAARPVGTVYSPEVAARAIAWAAERAPRDVTVGAPVEMAVLAHMLAPGLMDRYVGTHAWEAQLSPGPADDGRLDNLFAPIAADRGAHGRFGKHAQQASLLVWIQQHGVGALAATGLAVGGLAVTSLTATRGAVRRRFGLLW